MNNALGRLSLHWLRLMQDRVGHHQGGGGAVVPPIWELEHRRSFVAKWRTLNGEPLSLVQTRPPLWDPSSFRTIADAPRSRLPDAGVPSHTNKNRDIVVGLSSCPSP